jgi:hypothetical protein
MVRDEARARAAYWREKAEHFRDAADCVESHDEASKLRHLARRFDQIAALLELRARGMSIIDGGRSLAHRGWTLEVSPPPDAEPRRGSS